MPDKPGLLWYAGTMAAAEFIEWPIAALVAGTHFIEHHSRNRDIQELAEGKSTPAYETLGLGPDDPCGVGPHRRHSLK